MDKKTWFVALALSVFVALTAVLFHYPVHIQNALTMQPEPGFDVHVSGWRTIFEPFLGVLLYFNRAFYAVEEFIVLLYWLVGLFVVFVLVRSFSLKDKKQLKPFLAGRLISLIILIGLWFAVFMLIIFVPLPNDRIVNKTTDWVLVTTHSHTEFSHDGLISQEGLLKWHQRSGFDAFFITEHNNHNRTLEFVNSRLNRNLAGEPVVFCGEEFSGSNHLSLLGLKTDFSTKGLPDSVVVAKARSEGAVVLVNHWFDGERKTLEYYRDLGVDGFEIENTASDKRYNREVYRRIKTFCENNGLIMNGGLDFHGYGSACTLWNAFKITGWKNLDDQAKEEAILNSIRTRDQNKLKILLLNDRPYYDKENLLFSPVVTSFNYFRTLNFLQVISWVCWIFLLAFVYNRITSIPELTRKMTCWRVLPLAGMVAAIFLISLGFIYFFRNQRLENFTEMYLVYGRILCLSGFALLIFSGVVWYFSVFKKSGITMIEPTHTDF